jgi:hypothetical protein
MASDTSAESKQWYFDHAAPGVYLQDTFRLPQRSMFATGVPIFIGLVSDPSPEIQEEKVPAPHMLSLWGHFGLHIGTPTDDCWLAYAVRGFFENGGGWCYVLVLKDNSIGSMEEGLAIVAQMNTVDLVCAPDLVRDRSTAFDLQQMLIIHCETAGDRFAILDSRVGDSKEDVWNQWRAIDGKNGAIYYPWVRVQGFGGKTALVPPCGYVVGVYARTDHSRGVHKAPANEVLQGVLGLERSISDDDQAFLNSNRVNCLRFFPGRGIRVWGARTLSGSDEWTYVNVRRLFLTAVRWMDWHMGFAIFEPNDATLWARIERVLNHYFLKVYRQGALKGHNPGEAFYVKCDAETNPPQVREAGLVVTEVGLAPAVPYEFVVVRLIHGASGVTISGPFRPEQT